MKIENSVSESSREPFQKNSDSGIDINYYNSYRLLDSNIVEIKLKPPQNILTILKPDGATARMKIGKLLLNFPESFLLTTFFRKASSLIFVKYFLLIIDMNYSCLIDILLSR